jgi:transcriptional/translational regulatory protein YebC/TACO1
MFMFDRKGIIQIEGEGLDEDTVMEAALEAGAEDFEFDGDVFEIATAPNDLGTVRDALEEAGYSFLSAEVCYVPQTMSSIDDEESIKKMEKLIDMLEENDDVQAVWHNWEMPEE